MTRRPSAFSTANRTARAGAVSLERRDRDESGIMNIWGSGGRGNEGWPGSTRRAHTVFRRRARPIEDTKWQFLRTRRRWRSDCMAGSRASGVAPAGHVGAAAVEQPLAAHPEGTAWLPALYTAHCMRGGGTLIDAGTPGDRPRPLVNSAACRASGRTTSRHRPAACPSATMDSESGSRAARSSLPLRWPRGCISRRSG